MSEHTPSTEQVRTKFAATNTSSFMRNENEAEFDRWLAQHDAEVAEKALRDVAGTLFEHSQDGDLVSMRKVRAALYARAEAVTR